MNFYLSIDPHLFYSQSISLVCDGMIDQKAVGLSTLWENASGAFGHVIKMLVASRVGAPQGSVLGPGFSITILLRAKKDQELNFKARLLSEDNFILRN
jgi:hypothetical protein